MWKWLAGTLVGLALLCGGGGWLLAQSGTLEGLGRAAEQPVEVRLEPVVRQKLVRRVQAPGTVKPRRSVQLSAQVSARIQELPFEEGDDVRAGDVVVRLDDEDLAAALESAEANLMVYQAMLAQERVNRTSAAASLRSEEARLNGARAALSEARASVGRVRELFDSGDVARAELDVAEAAHEQAVAGVVSAEAAVEIAQRAIERIEAQVLGGEAQVAMAQASIRRARKDLENATITSPIDGTITSLPREVGELVMVGTLNNPASTIMEIADLSEMLVEARVDEANVAAVASGQPAEVFINAYPGRSFAGRVRRVGKQRLTHTDGTYYFDAEVAIELADGEELRSGLTATSEIEVEVIEGALLAPSQGVQSRRVDDLPAEVRDDNPLVDADRTFAWVVYTVAGGRAQARAVSIGASDLSSTQIVEGLQEGDRVIAGPYRVLQDLRHGQAVTVEGEAPPRRTLVGGAGEAPQGS